MRHVLTLPSAPQCDPTCMGTFQSAVECILADDIVACYCNNRSYWEVSSSLQAKSAVPLLTHVFKTLVSCSNYCIQNEFGIGLINEDMCSLPATAARRELPGDELAGPHPVRDPSPSTPEATVHGTLGFCTVCRMTAAALE
jgi:hypothetical protein